MISMLLTSQIFILNYTSPHIYQTNIKTNLYLSPVFNDFKTNLSVIKILYLYLIIESFYFLIFSRLISIIHANIKLLIRKADVMYSKSLLWDLRTKLPMSLVLANLENNLLIPFKESEGYIRFLCPICNEMQATVNPKNNLSHCFSCKKNFNNIDLLMFKGYSFSNSVEILICLWDELKSRSQTKEQTLAWQNSNPPTNIGEKL